MAITYSHVACPCGNVINAETTNDVAHVSKRCVKVRVQVVYDSCSSYFVGEVDGLSHGLHLGLVHVIEMQVDGVHVLITEDLAHEIDCKPTCTADDGYLH